MPQFLWHNCYHGSFCMKQELKFFVESLLIKTVFLHKDEFEKQYKIQSSLLAVYVATNATIREMITKQEIDSCQDLEQLKKLE